MSAGIWLWFFGCRVLSWSAFIPILTHNARARRFSEPVERRTRTRRSVTRHHTSEDRVESRWAFSASERRRRPLASGAWVPQSDPPGIGRDASTVGRARSRARPARPSRRSRPAPTHIADSRASPADGHHRTSPPPRPATSPRILRIHHPHSQKKARPRAVPSTASPTRSR